MFNILSLTPIRMAIIAPLFTIASYGNSQDAPVLMNGSRKCGIYTQWNFTRPWRKMKSYHLQVNRWNWRTSSWVRSDRLRRTKIICSPSYADFRSRANAAMLLDLDHKKRGEQIWDIRIGRKPKIWKHLMSPL
jgi:hypothetical protein